jgi:uncharacterized protein with HEPN domain
MSEDVLLDQFKSILESIEITQDRFDTIQAAEDFVTSPEGVTKLDSIAMRLQIIGEIIKSIDTKHSTLFQNYPLIDWKKIMKLRDLISHHYDIINHKIIFDICKNHIPKLKNTITQIINDLSKNL